MDRRLLGIYLQDHYAAAVGGVELGLRALRNNRDTRWAAPLEKLTEEIAEDRAMLRQVMERLGLKPSPFKNSLAWVVEKLGRLKLNGRLAEYSPLSRLIELEGLALGVFGKQRMWMALNSLAPRIAELSSFDFAALDLRAQAQQRWLEALRAEAVAAAVLPGRRAPSLLPAPV